jgi:hypothetical protein
MSMTFTGRKVAVSTTVMCRSPLVQSSHGSSRSVFTSPIDMFHSRVPPLAKMFSCGLSPVPNEPSCAPVLMSSTCTVFEVDADTATRVPSGDTAMWSARNPDTGNRHRSAPVRRSMETTSAKLGRDTTSALPSGVAYMSSTSWSCPSPGP